MQKPEWLEVAQISASYSVKVNLGNYESAEASHHMVVKLPEQATHAQIREAQQYANQEVKRAALLLVARAVEQRKAVQDSIFNALPEVVRNQLSEQ